MGLYQSSPVHVIPARTQRVVLPPPAPRPIALVLLTGHTVEFIDERFEEDDRSGGVTYRQGVHFVRRWTE